MQARKKKISLKEALHPNTCVTCGKKVAADYVDCPYCFIPVDGVSWENPTQLIRTYEGKHLTEQFQEDARRLAKYGWQVHQQNAMGEARVGIGEAFIRGARSSRNAKELVVIYNRV